MNTTNCGLRNFTEGAASDKGVRSQVFDSLRKIQSAISDATDPAVKPVALEKPVKVVMMVNCDFRVQKPLFEHKEAKNVRTLRKEKVQLMVIT